MGVKRRIGEGEMGFSVSGSGIGRSVVIEQIADP